MKRFHFLTIVFLIKLSSGFSFINDPCLPIPNSNLSGWFSFDGEPSIATNPANSNNIIAGWMSLRLDGKIWIQTKASVDGGTSWDSSQFLPHQNSTYASADVCIIFSKSGIAYLSYVDYRLSPDTTGGVFVCKSTNAGINWTAPVKAFDALEKPDLPIDRPWITVDNSGGPFDGYIYLITMSAYWYQNKHHIYCKRSVDGGINWSLPARVEDDSLFSVGISKLSFGVPSVGASSRLCAAYMSYDPVISPFVRVISSTSTDAGNTFQRSFVSYAYPIDTNYSRLWSYSLSADPVRIGNIIITWADKRYGDLNILLTRSTNSGQSWDSPVRINDDPQGNQVAQELVWSDFSVSGNLAIAWRDRRINGQGNVPFDIFTSISTNGGSSFSSNYRLSSASSPKPYLPCCNSFLGISASSNYIDANWGDYRTGDWEIFYAREQISSIIAVEKINNNIPDAFVLYQNYPNPFNPKTIIKFDLPTNLTRSGAKGLNVKLIILDALGREIQTLINEQLPPGTYQAEFNSGNLSSGVYFYKIETEEFTETKKMLLIK